jgi:hypothetical protein
LDWRDGKADEVDVTGAALLQEKAGIIAAAENITDRRSGSRRERVSIQRRGCLLLHSGESLLFAV